MNLEIIQNKIFEIRGCKVMLDFDLANLYEIETLVFRTLSGFGTLRGLKLR